MPGTQVTSLCPTHVAPVKVGPWASVRELDRKGLMWQQLIF